LSSNRTRLAFSPVFSCYSRLSALPQPRYPIGCSSVGSRSPGAIHQRDARQVRGLAWSAHSGPWVPTRVPAAGSPDGEGTVASGVTVGLSVERARCHAIGRERGHAHRWPISAGNLQRQNASDRQDGRGRDGVRMPKKLSASYREVVEAESFSASTTVVSTVSDGRVHGLNGRMSRETGQAELFGGLAVPAAAMVLCFRQRSSWPAGAVPSSCPVGRVSRGPVAPQESFLPQLRVYTRQKEIGACRRVGESAPSRFRRRTYRTADSNRARGPGMPGGLREPPAGRSSQCRSPAGKGRSSADAGSPPSSSGFVA
jgi:hypothetical protein